MLLPFSSVSMSLNQPMKQVIMNQNQVPLLHPKPLRHLQHCRGHLSLVCRWGGRGVQDKQPIVRRGLPSAMPYCRIPMTLRAVIPSQSFLRTSTSATPSHKTATLIMNVAYCSFFVAMWSLPFELYL